MTSGSGSSRFDPPRAEAPALRELLENSGWLHGLALRMLGDEHLAADAVQQTYAAALENPPPSARNLRGWLVTVVRNFSRMTLRRDQRRCFRESRVGVRETAFATDVAVERDEIRERLTEQVLGLHEPYRSTVLLHYYDGLTPIEIARVEGVPANTVRVRLARAAVLLRERIERRYNGESRDWLPGLVALAGIDAGTAVVPAAAPSLSQVTPAAAEPGITGRPLPSTTGSAVKPSFRVPAEPTRMTPTWRLPAAVVVVFAASVGTWQAVSWLGGTSRGDLSVTATDWQTQVAEHPLTSAEHGGGVTTVPTSGTDSIGNREVGRVGDSTSAVSEVVSVRLIDVVTRQPIEGATVLLAPYDMQSRNLARGRDAAALLMLDPPFENFGPTDARGEVSVPRGRLEREQLRARAPGYQEYFEPTRYRDLEDGRAYVVTVDPAVEATVLVRGHRGESLAGVTVSLHGSRGHRHTGVTSELGRLTFPWQDDAYLYTVREPGRVAVRDLASLPETTVILEHGAALEITVLDEHGRPLRECRVEQESPYWRGCPDMTITDAGGRFAALAVPEGKSVRVRLTHDEFAPLDAIIDWADGPRVNRRELTLTRGVRVSGQVLDPRGRPVAAGTVRLLPVAGAFLAREVAEAAVQADGSFVCGPVPLGQYVLAAVHPTLAPGEISVDARDPDGKPWVSLGLETGASLSGRVVNPNGEPLRGVALHAGSICGDELWGPTTVTDKNGVFRFENLPPVPLPVRAALRDLRWMALANAAGELPPTGLILQVMRPDRLLEKDGEAIPGYGALGSRNTCAINPGERDLQLVVAQPADTSRLRFALETEDGRRVRTLTNLLVVPPEDSIDSSLMVFGGLSATPSNIDDTRRLAGSLVGVLSRTYATKYLFWSADDRDDAVAPMQIPVVTLEPRRSHTLRLLDPAGQPIAGRSILLVPRGTGRETSPVGILLGTTDARGSLHFDFLASGSYGLSTPSDGRIIEGPPGVALVSRDETVGIGEMQLPPGRSAEITLHVRPFGE